MDADTPAAIQAELDARYARSRPAPPVVPDGAVVPPAVTRPVRVGRSTIDDALLAHDPDAGPPTLQTVQAADLVRRAALALDQVAHRSDAALAEHGRLPRDVARANDDDMAVADRLLREAATVHAVVGRMVETMRGRLSAVSPGGPPTKKESDAMDKKQYESEASGHAGPADAPPDSPHGGLGKGKQEGIEAALKGEPVADQPADEGTVEPAGAKAEKAEAPKGKAAEKAEPKAEPKAKK